jgi:hypothetical protein
MIDIPATRYVKSDAVHVAYQVLGEGPVDLLWAQGFVSHMEAAWQNPKGAALLAGCLHSVGSFCSTSAGLGCPIAVHRISHTNSACMTSRSF